MTQHNRTPLRRFSAATAAVLLLTLALLPGLSRPDGAQAGPNAPAGDDNVHWNELYHNDPGSYNPQSELVPGESYPFREVHGDGSADIYLLALDGDLGGALLYWNVEADGWAHHETAFTRVKSLTAGFHGQASATYELWQATVSGRSDGQLVYYRIRAVDGTAQAFLKNNGSAAGYALHNPLGQWVWSADDPYSEGNWVYTATDGGPAPDLGTSAKAVSAASASAGDTLTYTIDLHNTGSLSASVRLTDTLPAGLSAVPASLPAGMVQVGAELRWSGTLGAGASTALPFRATIDPGVDNTTLVNSVLIDDGAGQIILRQASTQVGDPGPCAGATSGDGQVVTAELYHSSLDPAYRDPLGAVSMDDPATLRLRTCHGDAAQVQALVWKTGEPLGAPGLTLDAAPVVSGTYDYWTVSVPPPDTLIDQWYQFKLVDGSLTGYYHPAGGNSGPGVWYTHAGGQQDPSWSLPRSEGQLPPDCSGTAVGDGSIRGTQIYHVDTDPAYRDPLGNISMGATATLHIRTCLNDVTSIQAWVWKTGAGATPSYTYDAAVDGTDASYAYWRVVVPAPDVLIDQWYQFKLVDGAASGYYHPLSGNTGAGTWSTSGPGTSWKLGTNSGPVPDVDDVPAWMQDAVIYQIFPDRFYNGDTANDALIEGSEVYGTGGCVGYPHPRPPGFSSGCIHDLRAWGDPLLNPSWGMDFYGGDLQGVIDKINAGYFDDLGVNTLYLNPIFEASSNHGYDTNDYYTVRSYFGTDATFDQLIAAADAHGLRVILDAVFNHAGMDSLYIDHDKNNNGACASAASPYRPWFTPGSQGSSFNCDGGWGWKGWYGYETIPELVDDDDGVRDFFFRGGSTQSPGGVSVSEYWLDRGIAGWRFDVAQDISHDWFQEMRPYFKDDEGAHYGSPDVLMLGEVTGGCASGGLYESYTRGDQLDSVMNYCFRDWVAGFASGNSPEFFANSFDDFRAQYPPAVFYAMMNLISSHDSPRLLQMVGGDYANVKLAVLLQMTLPGAPSVYYGDEVGLPGGSDPDNRRPYPWGAPPDPTMFAHFQKVIGLRNTHSALRGGDYRRLLVSGNIYAFARWDSSETAIVALKNVAGDPTQAIIPVSAFFPDGTMLTDVLNGNATYTVSGGSVAVPVNGRWGVVLVGPGQVQPNRAPTMPSGPSPATGASSVPTTTSTLQWSGGDPDGDVVTYTVAFGSSPAPSAVGTVRHSTVYTLGSALAAGTTYHWRISASDGLSTTVGPLWSFSTAAVTADHFVYLPIVLRGN